MSEAVRSRVEMSDHIPYAVGLLLLGAIGFAFRDFALQWQPVPDMLPQREIFAALSAGVLLACGVALFTADRTVGAIVAAGYFASWVLLLHLPRVSAKPADVSLWLGFAEISALALGGIAAVLRDREGSSAAFSRRFVQYAFAACVGVFGLSHFVYAQFTATLVPSWIPGQLFWAYATGIGHLAASASLFFGVLTRLSSVSLTCMLAIITLLVGVPRVIATPGSHAEWTALAVSIGMTGAAWLVAAMLRPQSKQPVSPRVADEMNSFFASRIQRQISQADQSRTVE